jgi:hypothetical protein
VYAQFQPQVGTSGAVTTRLACAAAGLRAKAIIDKARTKALILSFPLFSRSNCKPVPSRVEYTPKFRLVYAGKAEWSFERHQRRRRMCAMALYRSELISQAD